MTEAEEQKPMEMKKKVRIGAMIFVGIILIIFMLSNLGSMELELFFGVIDPFIGPKAFFLFFFLLIGFVLGFGTCLYWMRRTRDVEDPEASSVSGRQEAAEAEPEEKAE